MVGTLYVMCVIVVFSLQFRRETDRLLQFSRGTDRRVSYCRCCILVRIGFPMLYVHAQEYCFLAVRSGNYYGARHVLRKECKMDGQYVQGM